jgi:hypothetical protein
MIRACLALACMLTLAGCYEPASSWSEKQGRFRPTDEVRREIINEEIDKRERETHTRPN